MMTLPVKNDEVLASQITRYSSADVAKIALVKRHKGMSGVTVGLVSGFGFTEKCAIASTVRTTAII